ncbi:DUF421 domain-containing protein [Devosia submarina]|uniref:DUF421 domain-containing protein n=1 Tax=Devosia submarina TaxID=1173082 RepID=UPI000D35275B|nr:YetF domain-containing protein [Devosia submarina]
MDPAAIELFDWGRIFFGDQSPLFLAEILFRTIVIYFYTLGLLRWLGSRAVGQLSNLEFLLVIALGSAVGDAMFYPDVPLTHALAVVTLVVFANKGLDTLMARRPSVERALDGVPEEAINAGVICLSFFEKTALSDGELFQQLRGHGIEHLGEVEHAYIETNGTLTVFRAKQGSRPGLPIVPPWEISPPVEISPKDTALSQDLLACFRCGTTRDPNTHLAGDECPNCKHTKWTIARS